MIHLSLSPQLTTGLAALAVTVLTYIATNAANFTSGSNSVYLAAIAGAIAAFISHNYATASTPAPTSNAGAPSTVAGPPPPG